MEKLGSILKGGDFGPSKHMKHEFQDFGYRLATTLGDLEHRSLYMRLAKREPRGRLERALSFVKDASNLDGEKSKAKLFMWKLKQLRDGDRSGQ